MAVTEDIRNLDFPLVTDKEATLELEKVVTTDSEGDEVYILSATPGATTLGTGGATISPTLTEYAKAGYVRSSGAASPPFTISASNNTFQISIDGSTVRSVTLDSGTGLTGDDIADDMQIKINALAATGGDEEGNLAFLNCIVSYENGRFVIVSGSLSKTYTGTGKSSVAITAGATNDVTATLGLDILASSEELSSILVSEAELTGVTIATSGATLIPLDNVTNFSAGQAFSIYDGTNRDYFVATSISGSYLVTHSGGVPDGTYSTGAIVQNIFERDPDATLASPYESVDDLVRALLRTIAVQIDFES